MPSLYLTRERIEYQSLYFFSSLSSIYHHSLKLWLRVSRMIVSLIERIPRLFQSFKSLYHQLLVFGFFSFLKFHLFIVLLIVGLFSQVVDVPNLLSFLRLGHVWPQTLISCYVWRCVGTAGYITIGILTAWASIERHILVFVFYFSFVLFATFR
jgi:hypothetical protein